MLRPRSRIVTDVLSVRVTVIVLSGPKPYPFTPMKRYRAGPV
jgi:hypothetical protein